jgi:hypothetical protein
MKKLHQLCLPTLLAIGISVAAPARPVENQGQSGTAAAHAKPVEIEIRNGPVPIRVLAQSPADTAAELQVICLFQSDPSNTLHGSLTEIDERLKGLLGRLRTPALFRGELGETILIAPPRAVWLPRSC